MPTAFIAVQCCQCSTMQVKQQKKSSNKWTCVVCNQKQSVRKVYAQAFMAKEVRCFVQNFNMSRQLADQQLESNQFAYGAQCEEHTETLEVEDNHLSDCYNKRRTDWREYVDPEDGKLVDNDEETDPFEPKVVTELPKALFKKPKLKNYSGGSWVGDKGLKPVFHKRNKILNKTSHVMDRSGCQPRMRTGPGELTDYAVLWSKESTKFQQSVEALKWKEHENENEKDGYGSCEPTKGQELTAKLTSRKNYYIIENDESCGNSIFPGKEYAKSLLAAEASKRRGIQHENNHGSKGQEPTKHQQRTVSMVSKWSDYIAEDEEESGGSSGRLQPVSPGDPMDYLSHWKSDIYDMVLGDQKVEEDVHPDFL